jgi:hypothetical protein
MVEDGVAGDQTQACGPQDLQLPMFGNTECSVPGQDDDLDLAELDDLEPIREPGPPRLCKVGGIIGWMTDSFVAVEARFLREARLCSVCEIQPREDGRLLCGCCQVKLRPAKLTPAEKEARRLQAYAIARQRAKAGQRDARAAAVSGGQLPLPKKAATRFR